MDQKRKYEDLIKNNHSRRALRKGSSHYWATVAWSLVAFLNLRKEAIKNKLSKRETAMKDMESAVKLYVDIAKSWIMKAIKKPLISIFNDMENNFNFTEPGIDKVTKANRIMKVKVRVKGVFQAILDATDPKIMPVPLIVFLASLLKPKCFVPDHFLTEFELNRVKTDSYGALLPLKTEQVQMITSFFVVGKVLLGKILLNPVAAGITIKFNDRQQFGFKLVSTLTYLTYLEYVTQLTARFQHSPDSPSADGISPYVY